MSEPRVKTIHVHLDARGAFTNFRKREWRNVVKDEEGRYLTPDEVKEWLLDQIAQGKKALPFGEPCEGFSYETGCPGHQAVEAERIARGGGE